MVLTPGWIALIHFWPSVFPTPPSPELPYKANRSKVRRVGLAVASAVSDCRAAREAWLASPRSTTRFTSMVFPHGFGCLDWPHAQKPPPPTLVSVVFVSGLSGCLGWWAPGLCVFARQACQVAWAGGARVHFDGFPAWLWLPGLAPRTKTTSPALVSVFCVSGLSGCLDG